MSPIEHYFENLLTMGSDIKGEPNKNALSKEVQETVEICADYIKNIQLYSNAIPNDSKSDAEYKEPTTKNDLEIVMDAMEYRTNSLIENIKSEIMHFANAHCSGDDINVYDVLKVIDDCCEAENSTTKNDLGVRKFEEIVVEYPPEELCTYPEYKGKPYFSIKYKEGNDYIIGYGTYKPEVLSQYLKDYFISTTKNNLGVDTDKLIADCEKMSFDFELFGRPTKALLLDAVKNIVKDLPSVTPQEPRKGEWVRMSDLSEQEDDRYKCSRCGNVIHHKNKMDLYTFNSWCGRCGSDNSRHINYEEE